VNGYVALPARDAEVEPEMQSIEMLGAYFSVGLDYHGWTDLRGLHVPAFLERGFIRGKSQADTERLIKERKQKQAELRKSLEFIPQAGEDNIWVITLPDDLLELVRGNLKRIEEKTET
jgi:hypothetical protein